MSIREQHGLRRPGEGAWLVARVEEMLSASSSAVRPAHALIALALMLLYGGAMGSYGLWFGGNASGQWLQVAYSATKVPLLLGATFAISLPSFFVFNTMAGLGGDFRTVVRTLVAAQSALSVLLGALAPFTLLWYASGADYRTSVLFNGLVFAVASMGIFPHVRRKYRSLIERNARHRRMIMLWGILYGFIGIQMGWSLRPFIGDPTSSAEFFRHDGWSNAYMALWDIITAAISSPVPVSPY